MVLGRNAHAKRALELRARILIDEGDTQAARRDLKTLLALDPGHVWAKAQLDKGDRR